jgi:prevent-host-death family protein
VAREEVPVTEARKDLAELVNRVAYGGERIPLSRHGKVVAAIVSAEDLDLLERVAAERLDLTGTGPAPAPGAEPARTRTGDPLRIAAEYRREGPPRPPGFRA